MSGRSRDAYTDSFELKSKSLLSDTGREERSGRIKILSETAHKRQPPPKRDSTNVYDEKKVSLGITKPKPGIKRVHIYLVDNSGSNARIASHLKESSGYLTAGLGIIDSGSQSAFIYFSDHCDGDGLMQEVDYVSPDKEGDIVLHSTIRNVHPADGGDEAEAIECALMRACELDFGDATEKHLYLVTDVVAHGMGMDSDNGCPMQCDWKRAVKKVGEVFTTFEVIGCSPYADIGDLQKQFLSEDRVAMDHVDLSNIQEHSHRVAITGNALLFMVARKRGKQAMEAFLAFLYEKWLEEPIFGGDTDERAKEMIRRFGKYIELPEEEVEEMMKKILAE